MEKRHLVTLKIMVSEEAARALRCMEPREQPAALVRFLGAQDKADLQDAVHALRVVPWSDTAERPRGGSPMTRAGRDSRW
jgi:hypothetical protein